MLSAEHIKSLHFDFEDEDDIMNEKSLASLRFVTIIIAFDSFAHGELA
mgnify:FL=1